MSRSYRKTLEIRKDSYGSYRKIAKRTANKKVRKAKEIPNGKAYRKVFCSWEICDYKKWWSISDELKEDLRLYKEIIQRQKNKERLFPYEKKILNRGFPTYEKIYQERRRYKK